MRIGRLPSLCGGTLLAALTSCGSPPAPATPATATAPPPLSMEEVLKAQAHPARDTDICEGSPPVPHAPLSGILRNARCDQDMYYSMSKVGDMLGVECSYCHAAKVEGQKERNFPEATHSKDIANWMSNHLMSAIKQVDGSPMKCSSCHTDEHGQPIAKILGKPRDPVRANEWMSLVMVKKFVAADGSKLKCKSCHVGTPGTQEFQKTVILQTAPLPRHVAGSKGAPAF